MCNGEGNGPYMATPRYIYTCSFSLDQSNQSCPNFVADSWLCHRRSVESLSSFPPDPVKSAWKARLEIVHPLACRPVGDGGSGEEPAEPGRKQPRFVEDVVFICPMSRWIIKICHNIKHQTKKYRLILVSMLDWFKTNMEPATINPCGSASILRWMNQNSPHSYGILQCCCNVYVAYPTTCQTCNSIYPT